MRKTTEKYKNVMQFIGKNCVVEYDEKLYLIDYDKSKITFWFLGHVVGSKGIIEDDELFRRIIREKHINDLVDDSVKFVFQMPKPLHDKRPLSMQDIYDIFYVYEASQLE